MTVAASPSEIAGKHYEVYEQLYRHVDNNRTGTINAQEAATFLRRSNLSLPILTKIWDLSDSKGRGYLDKAGFFVALKYTAMAQQGRDLDESGLKYNDLSKPEMGINTTIPLMADASWDISSTEQAKYDRIFDGLNPVLDKLSGDKVRPVFIHSGLDNEILSKIWELSDIDKDGLLDREEFALAMHLVYNALNKQPVPKVLSPSLIPLSKRTNLISGLLQPMSTCNKAPVTQELDLSEPVLTMMEQTQYEAMFRRIDSDADGQVSGADLKDTFLSYGLDSITLSLIWAATDKLGTGTLNLKQFSMAMILIQRKLAMNKDGVGLDKNSTDEVPLKTELSVELEQLNHSINELKKIKLREETDRQQLKADICISNSELLSLEKKCEAVISNSTQLDSQKLEAQKRLDDIDEKRKQGVKELADIRLKFKDDETAMTELNCRLSSEAQDQKSQECELKTVKESTQCLRISEQKLNEELSEQTRQCKDVEKQIQSLQDEMKQFQILIESLEITGEEPVSSSEFHSDFATDTKSVSLHFETSAAPPPVPVPVPAPATLTESSFGNTLNVFDDDAGFGKRTSTFSSNDDPFGADPFANDSMFDNTKTKSQSFGLSNEDFAAFDSPSTTVSSSNQFSSAFGDDPFSGKLSSITPSIAANDPFASNFSGSSSKTSCDPFGQDPFAPSSNRKKSTKKKAAPTLPLKTPVNGTSKKTAPPPRPPAPKPSTNPLSKASPFSEEMIPATVLGGGGGNLTSGDIQLATRESRLTYERDRKLVLQENADMALAIALSKAEM